MRVRALSRKVPSMALVTAHEFCFSTPRIDMQRCVASITTATPSGEIFSQIVSAIWLGQPLLHLQPAAEDVDEPRNLAEADHLVARNVGDVALAEKRQQMMLAQAVEIDVLDDHHLAVVDREQRPVQDLIDVGAVAAGEKRQRLLDPLRRIEQTLALRILAKVRSEAV